MLLWLQRWASIRKRSQWCLLLSSPLVLLLSPLPLLPVLQSPPLLLVQLLLLSPLLLLYAQ